MQDRPEQRPAFETTDTVEGDVGTATQVGTIAVFRGNTFMFDRVGSVRRARAVDDVGAQQGRGAGE